MRQKLSPEAQQRIAVIVPILALVLSLFVDYPAWGRYSALRTKIGQQEAELRTLKATPLPPVETGRPAVDAAPEEPPQFLAHVGAIATASNVRIAGFDLVSAKDAQQEIGEVRAVRAKVDVEGTYEQIRLFLLQLGQTDRLYVVADLDLRASTAGANRVVASGLLRATVTVERYVTSPARTAAKSPAGSP